MALYKILVADSEMSNLNALNRILKSEYNVLSAAKDEDILDILERNDIAIIIANYRMPNIADSSLLEEITRKYPDTIYIILGAYADEGQIIDAVNNGRAYGYITKPWEPEELKAIVKEGIETYEVAHVIREPNTRVLLHSGIISAEQLETVLRIQRAEEKPIEDILVKHSMISISQLDTAIKLQESKQNRLDEALIELEIISSDDLKIARGLQKHERRTLGEIIVDLGYANEESIYSCYALQLGMPYISLSQFSDKPGLAKLLPSELAYKHSIVPVDIVGRVLVVAALEPLSDKAKSEIEKEAGYKVMSVCTSHQDIETALEQYYSIEQKEEKQLGMQGIMGTGGNRNWKDRIRWQPISSDR